MKHNCSELFKRETIGISQTCDFIDNSPSSKATYWVAAVVNKKEQASCREIEVDRAKLMVTNYC